MLFALWYNLKDVLSSSLYVSLQMGPSVGVAWRFVVNFPLFISNDRNL